VRTVILTIASAALALVVQGSVLAQPLATIALPEPSGTVQLYPGCNPIALTFPDGTPSQAVAQAVSPAGTVQAIWGFSAALGRFQGFSPAAPQASDLLTVGYLDAVWLCVAESSTSEEPPPVAKPDVFEERYLLVDVVPPARLVGRGVWSKFDVSLRNTSRFSACELRAFVEVGTTRGIGSRVYWQRGRVVDIGFLGSGETIDFELEVAKYLDPLLAERWKLYKVVLDGAWCGAEEHWQIFREVFSPAGRGITAG